MPRRRISSYFARVVRCITPLSPGDARASTRSSARALGGIASAIAVASSRGVRRFSTPYADVSATVFVFARDDDDDDLERGEI